ncbi:MAG: glycine betaine/L-proline ABC transporter ATP-binding protein [Spirochaetales bacterium]|nr:glycine betaine/L-proline ABC transporter ATP-binding protein [Spirochaetales bacterium]
MEEKQIVIKELWKIFGKDPKRVLKNDNLGLTKTELKEKTGCVVGLKNINLEINKGEFYILMGLSGSGKSTLLRNIIRLVKPTSGDIVINNKNITKMTNDEILEFRKDTFGMVFQHYGLLPHLTVIDNVAFGLKIKGLSKEERYSKALEVIKTVGLSGWEYNYPGNLSGGMQQRVGIARALANDPDILLMDEPFSGLDPLIKREMQDELVELQDRLKKTIIFVTHDLHEALKLGDRIAILKDGEIVQIGKPEEIVTNPEDSYVKEFVKDASPAKVLTAGCVMEQPDVLIYSWEGPRTALTMLRSSNRKIAFVVNKHKEFLGVVNESALLKIIDNEPSATNIPKEIIKPRAFVHLDTLLEDMFHIMAKEPLPIAVIDENNKFKGKITTDILFENIIPLGGHNE